MSLPLKHYKDLLMQYLKPQWRRVLLMVILLLASVGLQLVNPLVLRYFIDTVIAGGSALSMTIAGVIFIGIALTNQAVSVFATYISQNVAWTATNSLRVDLVAHCLALDMAFHKVHTSGELIERIDGDVNTLSNFFSEFVVHLLMNTILLVGILIVLFFERLHLCVSRDKVVHSRKVGVFDNRNLRADTDMQARCVSCCHREREFRGANGAPSTIRTYAHQVPCPVSMANGRTVHKPARKGRSPYKGTNILPTTDGMRRTCRWISRCATVHEPCIYERR